MTRTTTCTKRYTEIPFSHRQHMHEGHCRHIHGHGWSFEFEFVASEKDACGFVVDFGGLKPLKKWLDDKFDHAIVISQDDPLLRESCFHETLERTRITGSATTNLLVIPDCSAEGIAEYLAKEVQSIVSQMTNGRVAVKRVTVYEDSKNSATCEAI